MPVTTIAGDAPWSVKEVAGACGVARAAGVRKIRQFEQGMLGLLAAARQARPTQRPCDLAAMLAAVAQTTACLAAYDRPRLMARLRELAERAAAVPDDADL